MKSRVLTRVSSFCVRFESFANQNSKHKNSWVYMYAMVLKPEVTFSFPCTFGYRKRQTAWLVNGVLHYCYRVRVGFGARRQALTNGSDMCRDNLQTSFTSDAQVIPGQDGRAVEALCWVGQRLFSAGLNGEITEYDLENLRPKYTMEAYGGPIWTISSNSQGTLLTVSHDTLHIKFHPDSCFLGWN